MCIHILLHENIRGAVWGKEIIRIGKWGAREDKGGERGTVHAKLERQHLHGVEDVAQLVVLACLESLESWSSVPYSKSQRQYTKSSRSSLANLVGSKSASAMGDCFKKPKQQKMNEEAFLKPFCPVNIQS